MHIAFDGIKGTGKTLMAKKLVNFLENKNYKVYMPVHSISNKFNDLLKNYELTNYEKALITAFIRSLSLDNHLLEKYDIIVWDNSILSSLVYHTDKKTPKNFIKQINKYFPEMDLYIIIQPNNDSEYVIDEINQNTLQLLKKYDNLIKNHKNAVKINYIPNNEEKMFKEVINQIYKELPRCNWCGRFFTPTKHYKKYCKDECRKFGLQEQRRINNSNYYYKYKDVMTEKQKGGLGSKGANLHGKADSNPLIELQKVRNAKKALGLKPIQDQ